MDINKIILLYALSEITFQELRQILKGIGFSSVIVGVLTSRAEYNKGLVACGKVYPIDIDTLWLGVGEYISHLPNFPELLDENSAAYSVTKLRELYCVIKSPSQIEGWEQPKSNAILGGL